MSIIKMPDPQPLPPAPRYRVSKIEFRDKFTMDEKEAIYSTAADPTSPLRFKMQIFLDDLMSAEFVDLDNPQTIESINTFAVVGIIAQERIPEILAPVEDGK